MPDQHITIRCWLLNRGEMFGCVKNSLRFGVLVTFLRVFGLNSRFLGSCKSVLQSKTVNYVFEFINVESILHVFKKIF